MKNKIRKYQNQVDYISLSYTILQNIYDIYYRMYLSCINWHIYFIKCISNILFFLWFSFSLNIWHASCYIWNEIYDFRILYCIFQILYSIYKYCILQIQYVLYIFLSSDLSWYYYIAHILYTHFICYLALSLFHL